MRSVQITYRPLTFWPGEVTQERKRSPFDSPWSATMDLLDRELWMLDAKDVALQLALAEHHIRNDGLPRANAPNPSHPGVVIAFDSKFGALQYATDTFLHWQANVRAIALGLEALRKVDRYGITKRGEQYTGWKALAADSTTEADRGRELIRQYGGVTAALMATHPDRGGDACDFHAVQVAREVGHA